MIPTIETICEDLAAGKITVQQAIGWLYVHAEGATNGLRDHFAAAALTGFCANSYSDGVQKPLSLASVKEMAEIAFSQADAMLAAREPQSHEGEKP